MALSPEHKWGIGLMLIGVGLGILGAVFGTHAAIVVGVLFVLAGIIVLLLPPRSKQIAEDGDQPCFSFEAQNEIHSYTPLDLFIRNCGRTARDITFDPLTSKSGHHTIRFDPITSLARDERHRLTFHTGGDETWLIKGVVNHLILFFDDNPQKESKVSYTLTIRFLDGKRPMRERHVFEGESLAKGGVKLRIHPAVSESARQSHDYDTVVSLRNSLQAFLDELGEEPKPDYKLGHDEFNQRLQLIGQFENRLQHGFQLRFAAKIQTLIHVLGEKNMGDADLTLAMRQPAKNLETLRTIRDRLSVLVSDLRPHS